MNGCGGRGSRWRCAAVWSVTTAAWRRCCGGCTRTWPGPSGPPPAPAHPGAGDGPRAGGGLAAAGCAGWAWAVTTVTVAQAATGANGEACRVPGRVAGGVLAACGVAVLSGTGRAGAGPRGAPETPAGPRLVAGLPLPDRPTGRLPHLLRTAVLVEPGDSLWSLAVERLPRGADAAG